MIISFNFLAVRCENTLKNIEIRGKSGEKKWRAEKNFDGLTWIIRTPCSRKSWWIEGRARRIAVIYAEIREQRNARGADVTWSRRKTRSHSRDRNFPPLSAWQSFHAVDTFSSYGRNTPIFLALINEALMAVSPTRIRRTFSNKRGFFWFPSFPGSFEKNSDSLKL